MANARKLRLIYSNKRKTDKVDAENLARLASLDPKLLYPLKHRGEASQAHMAIIRSREALVSCRTQLVNHVRGAVKSFGGRLPKCEGQKLPQQRPSAYRMRFGRLLGPSWSRDRLADRAYPRLRSPAGGDLQGNLPRNGAPATGRGGRGRSRR